MTDINDQVFNGIRKTINRFREKPFHYFTEADIHSSLLNDIMSGGKGIVTKRTNNISISLVHQEYPTNYRYMKKKLLKGYDCKTDYKETSLNSKKGDRGNFDLAILNPEFVKTVIGDDIEKSMHHLISKDAKDAIERNKRNDKAFQEEILFAIEVKFIHYRNARNKSMIEEIIKDNEKLLLAIAHSDSFIKPINLIFCTSGAKKRRDKKTSVIEKVKSYVTGEIIQLYDSETKYHSSADVLTIFVESFIDEQQKKTEKPTTNFDNTNSKLDWAKLLIEKLKISNTS